MWEKELTERPVKISDDEINSKYEQGEKRILVEIGRERLPNFVKSLEEEDNMNIRPFYQRRLRWDKIKQSRLIESFLINIPVPPIILYETDYNRYEVMDGQQRITAIADFYADKLKLIGLTIWKELEGRTYSELPKKIRAGIDRRSISTITLITESTSNPEEALFLKQLAFERINTGGVDLSRQEVRNCLFYNQFNQLLLELAENPIFAHAWGIPVIEKDDNYDENDEEIKDKRAKRDENSIYKKMEDVELVLRFFALRSIDNFRGNLETFLDSYMMKSSQFSNQDIDDLRQIFLKTIELADQIYEDDLFQPYGAKVQNTAYKAYYDAVMVGLSNHLENAHVLVGKRLKVIEKTKELLNKYLGLFTGQGKTKKDLQNRIRLFDEMLKEVISEA